MEKEGEEQMEGSVPVTPDTWDQVGRTSGLMLQGDKD